MSNLYRGPSIDASYQVSVHLAKEFQRRRLKCEKLTDDGGQVMQKLTLPLARRAKNIEKIYKVLYKDCSFCPDPLTNMAATGNSCF
jgi:hypothetical protein